MILHVFWDMKIHNHGKTNSYNTKQIPDFCDFSQQAKSESSISQLQKLIIFSYIKGYPKLESQYEKSKIGNFESMTYLNNAVTPLTSKFSN